MYLPKSMSFSPAKTEIAVKLLTEYFKHDKEERLNWVENLFHDGKANSYDKKANIKDYFESSS